MNPITRRRMLELLGYGTLALTAEPLLRDKSSGGNARAAASCPSLSTRLTSEYGLDYPIVGAGMGFYALPELVAAISNAGALGVLGAAPEPPPRLALLIKQVKLLTPKIFGVDFVNTPLFGLGVPAVTDDHITVCIAEGVKVVVFFWNPPEQSWVDRLHEAGAKVWMQVGSVEGASDAVALGVDVLIAQGSEAGGHSRGAFEGSSTPRAQLVPAVIQEADSQIVLAAGGIADGQGLVDVLLEGAEGAWVGTRMAASVEAYAHKKWKKRVVAASAGDTVITPMFGPEFSGAHARVLRNRVVDQWAEHEDEIPFPPPPPPVIGVTMLNGLPYPMPKFSVALPTRDTLGDFEEMALFAGGVSAGLINDIKPAAEIVADMAADACAIIGDQLQT